MKQFASFISRRDITHKIEYSKLRYPLIVPGKPAVNRDIPRDQPVLLRHLLSAPYDETEGDLDDEDNSTTEEECTPPSKCLTHYF